MQLNILKRKLSIICAGAILTLTSSALPGFAAKTSEQFVDNGATQTSLIAQRQSQRRPQIYYRTRCRTIRRIRWRGKIWLVQRCRRFRCRRRRRCRLIRTWTRRIPA